MCLPNNLLTLKTDVNVPSESNKQNNLEDNLLFVGILKVTEEKSRIRIRNPVIRIRGSELHQNVTDPEYCRKEYGISIKENTNTF